MWPHQGLTLDLLAHWRFPQLKICVLAHKFYKRIERSDSWMYSSSPQMSSLSLHQMPRMRLSLPISLRAPCFGYPHHQCNFWSQLHSFYLSALYHSGNLISTFVRTLWSRVPTERTHIRILQSTRQCLGWLLIQGWWVGYSLHALREFFMLCGYRLATIDLVPEMKFTVLSVDYDTAP